MDERRHLVPLRIYCRSKVLRLRPATILEGALPDVHTAIAALAVAHKIECLVVDRERRLALPGSAVHRRAHIARLAPFASLVHTHIKVAAPTAVLAVAGGEEHNAAVLRYALRALVVVAVHRFRHSLRPAPLAIGPGACIQILFLFGVGRRGRLARKAAREDKRLSVGRERRQVLVILAVDGCAEVPRIERHRVGQSLLAETGLLQTILRIQQGLVLPLVQFQVCLEAHYGLVEVSII